jgi:hypothetical protein
MSAEYDRFMKVIADNGGLPIDNDDLAAEAIKDAVLDMGFDPIWATKILLTALDLVNAEFDRPDHKAVELFERHMKSRPDTGPVFQQQEPPTNDPNTVFGRILLRFYLRGHTGQPLPIWFRRMFPRCQIHRAWLSGRDGNFWERGVRYGPANPYPEPCAEIDAESQLS